MAVNVQAMVFGNMGNHSATGVCFTRNPSTGAESNLYGEFLINAQGEDVVAGIRTPEPIENLRDMMPKAYSQLRKYSYLLEKHFKDVQDIEFTIQENRLYIADQKRKTYTQAAVKIAVDMVREGLIDKKTAISRINPNELDQLLHPTFDPKAKKDVVAVGLPASPGAATGKVVFNAEDAEKLAAKKEKVILVRKETSPEDIGGMHVSRGILTTRGGMTSHAAVVARGMGKCCVAGCGALIVDYKSQTFKVGRKVVKREIISQ